MSSEESLPATQPMEVDCCPTSSPPSSLPWAWLVQLKPNTGSSSVLHSVCGENITVGRDKSCDLQVDERIFADSKMKELQFVELSRVHFEITKEKGGISLVDRSMNGTFANQLLVGKTNKYRLNHTDIISILKKDFSVFLYLDEKMLSSLYSSQVINKYLVGREVGRGSSAVVREGYTRGANTKVAMKFISKKKWPYQYSQPQDILMEVTILQELEHPCITKVLGAVEDENMLVIVMEFAAGGELFEQVVADHDKKKLTEEKAKIQFFQLSHTIAYIHSRKVCHRDLKLENILLMEPVSTSLVKVTDFGLSKQFSSTKLIETYVGTPMYMAPEIINCSNFMNNATYTCKADCWSLGVILYMLLCGHPPFKETSSQNLLSVISAGQYEPMVGPCWDKVTPLAKDLVRKLLDTDQEKRLNAEQVLSQQWFEGDKEVVDRAKEIMGMRDIMDSEVDSGIGSLKLSGSPEFGIRSEKKGEKRKKTEDLLDEPREVRKTKGGR